MAEVDGSSFSPDHGGEKLWSHKAPETTEMWKFLQHVNDKHKLQLKNYHDLLRWSNEHIADFWGEVWHHTGIKASKPYEEVVDESAPMYPRPAFFPGAHLNFAENLLFPSSNPDTSSLAIIAATETAREKVTWAQLRERVAVLQGALAAADIHEGDRVAGYVGNHVNAVVAMLAATSLGAIWTGLSPDSGVSMAVDRFKQVGPKVLFTDDGQVYAGKSHGVLGKVGEILEQLDSIKHVIIFEVTKEDVSKLSSSVGGGAKVHKHVDFVKDFQGAKEPNFKQLLADHPIYILYSSGTTGAPKCIVHGSIGTLIQHKKEHFLHSSVLPCERLFYFTTTTWMMWHWLISGLASGATLILYDGSPMRYKTSDTASANDDYAMAKLIDELEINHFGTSAKYLSVLEQKEVMPKDHGITLKTLKAIYNTASPLAPSTFRYVYKAFGPDINLGSITGGTDIISLFGAACPLVPVHAGEVQAPGLGMAIRAYTSDGKDVTDSGAEGDLVCIKAFPCQPVAFWGSDGAKRYKSSYFEKFPDIWHHGDYVTFNPQTGGVVMLGRSDGVLNPAGIRFGSAEIYNILLKHFPGEVADGLCVGRKREQNMDETVVLFVKMEPGKEFTPELADKIKKRIRSELSARHVPANVDECPDIPVTVNGKKIEGAVKQIISGSKVKTSASVSNADCLEFYKQWASEH